MFDSKIDGPGLEKLFQSRDNVIIELNEDELDEEEHDDWFFPEVKFLLSYEKRLFETL